jgi:hypothetical protein
MAKGDPKAHQLYKQVGGTTFIYDAETPFSTTTGEWNILAEDANAVVIVRREYIDLAGWSKQDLTTFTQGVDIQKQQIPVRSLTAGGSQWIDEYDFITTRRLTDAELTWTPGPPFSLPGFLESTGDLMEIIYGERMTYGLNQQILPLSMYVQISGETFGSGNPTAMDKLHWTRLFVIHYPADGDATVIYPTNLVVQAMTLEEKDLVWMERLRRSYVLQGEL